MKCFVFALCALALPLSAHAAGDQNDLAQRFMAAWNTSDPKALSALFAADADIVTPDGTSVHGRDMIRAFYGAVFGRGYMGSNGAATVVALRNVSPEIAVMDAQWSIANVHGADGKPRPAEHGILTAVVTRENGEWRILALRENTGAIGYTQFPPH